MQVWRAPSTGNGGALECNCLRRWSAVVAIGERRALENLERRRVLSGRGQEISERQGPESFEDRSSHTQHRAAEQTSTDANQHESMQPIHQSINQSISRQHTSQRRSTQGGQQRSIQQPLRMRLQAHRNECMHTKRKKQAERQGGKVPEQPSAGMTEEIGR